MIVPLPKVDRGSSNTENVIGVVKKKNWMNRIGTEHELLKLWFGPSNLQKVTSNFITINQVKQYKEITLREIAISKSQGYFSYACKIDVLLTVVHVLNWSKIKAVITIWSRVRINNF